MANRPITALLLAALFGLFLFLFAMTFATTQAQTYDTTANLTQTLDPGLLNDTVRSGDAMYTSFQSSPSDATSQISLFKNAPSTIKNEVQLSWRVFGRLFASGQSQFIPVWALQIIYAIVLLSLIGIFIWIATGLDW